MSDESVNTTAAPAVAALAEPAAASSSSAAAAPAAAAPQKTPTGIQEQPRTRTVPIEHGPLSLKEAGVLVINQYGNAFNNIIYQLEPVLRDGSVVRFCLPGNNMELAQGVIRFGTDPFFDKDHNAAVPVVVYNLSYPRNPTNMMMRPPQ